MSLLKPNPLSYAQVDWHDDQPESTTFGDIYFSKEDGIAETDYVFIQANQLPERFAALEPGEAHVIGETGFGTGLNFLSARALWLEKAPANCTLHFISCEKFPLRFEDLKRALSPLQEKRGFAAGLDQLLTQWPDAIEGFHRLQFDEGRIKLTLLFGEAAEQFSQLNARIDIWFLDGFAPAKNPDMWSDALFEQLDRLSHAGTRAATFTSAGLVKRGLQSAGFSITKIKGYGRKREMIVAEKSAESTTAFQQPWLRRPEPVKPTRIAIIGAGVAGTSTAFALAKRGVEIDIYERESQIATQGSGNPQGALYIKLPIKPTLPGEFHLRGFQYSQRLIQSLKLNDTQKADLCGLLQLASDQKDLQRLKGISESGRFPDSFISWVDAKQATELAGINITREGHYFPTSGWVAPAKLANHLLQLSGARLHTEANIPNIDRDESGWIVNGQSGYSHLILCTAWETDLVERLSEIRLKPIRGQTSWAQSDSLPRLNTVICSNGYISPSLENQYCFGASFKPGDSTTELRADEHQHNLELLAEVLPTLAERIDSEKLTGKAASRAASPDYMPLVGPLCEAKHLRNRYARLSTDAKAVFEEGAPWIDGLYVNLGHGSKGLVSCPISAEAIAAQIFNEPLPIEQELVDLISPQRFTIRALKRRKPA